MGSVSSVNPGVADLLQTLSSLNLPALSSPKVTSALKNAPTADIVQLSMAASELESVDAIFGISGGSNTGTSSALANLDALLGGSAGMVASGATGSPAGSLFDLMG